MPLIVMCGLPASGKTRRAQELAAFFARDSADVDAVQLISDDTLGIRRARAYSSAFFYSL